MQTRRVIVPVATFWTRKDAPRDVDALALKGDVKNWVAQMTTEQTIDLCDSKRLETQALFNDEVIIDHIEGSWTRAFITTQTDDSDPRGYAGWVPTASLSEAEVTYPTTTARVVVARPTTTLYDQHKTPIFDVSMGTTFTELANEGEWLKVATPFGEGYIKQLSIIVTAEGATTGEQMVAMAKQFLGLRYLWAGISSYGFDCSGLMYTLHRVMGFLIPRDADDQSVNGQPVAPENLQPGDLLFYAYDHGKGYVHHVGMYIGNGQMIQSRTPGKEVDIAKLTEMRYAPEYVGARRYWR